MTSPQTGWSRGGPNPKERDKYDFGLIRRGNHSRLWAKRSFQAFLARMGEIMNILLASFSATGNTAKIAGAVAKRLRELGATVDELDITFLEARKQPKTMDGYDAAVFGAPIHSMRAPRLARDWLASLDGQGKMRHVLYLWRISDPSDPFQHGRDSER